MLMTVKKLRNGRVQKSYAFEADRKRLIKIGKMAKADISIDEAVASRLQAVIEMNGKEASIREMGSMKETALNGEPILRHAENLYSDDRIAIGDTELQIVMSDVQKDPQAAAKNLFDGLSSTSLTELYRYADYLRHRDGLPPVAHTFVQPVLAPMPQPAPEVHRERDTHVRMMPAQMPQSATQAVFEGGQAPGAPGAREDDTRPSGITIVPEKYDTQRLVAQMQSEKRRGNTGLLLVAILAVAGCAYWFTQVGTTGIGEASLQAVRAAQASVLDASETKPEATTAVEKNKPAVKATAKPVLKTYTIRPGDTLGSIAKRELGSAAKWEALFAGNRHILSTPSALEVGMELRLPSQTQK